MGHSARWCRPLVEVEYREGACVCSRGELAGACIYTTTACVGRRTHLQAARPPRLQRVGSLTSCRRSTRSCPAAQPRAACVPGEAGRRTHAGRRGAPREPRRPLTVQAQDSPQLQPSLHFSHTMGPLPALQHVQSAPQVQPPAAHLQPSCAGSGGGEALVSSWERQQLGTAAAAQCQQASRRRQAAARAHAPCTRGTALLVGLAGSGGSCRDARCNASQREGGSGGDSDSLTTKP